MNGVSKQAIGRFPYYLKFLNDLNMNRQEYVSASMIASSLQLYEVQVRKDLAAVSRRAGKPGVGFPVARLIDDIKRALHYDSRHKALLVGAGHLGKALLSYKGFGDYGLEIVAAFDTNPSLHGQEVDGKTIFPIEELGTLRSRLDIKIGIITVPSDAAEKVCDILVSSGILAVWNFAPTYLSVPGHVLVQNENMAVSLALLSQHLAEKG
jgi:redox-sensing transcriptional repressor